MDILTWLTLTGQMSSKSTLTGGLMDVYAKNPLDLVRKLSLMRLDTS